MMAGHADILREQLDGRVGSGEGTLLHGRDPAYWTDVRTRIEQAASTFGAD